MHDHSYITGPAANQALTAVTAKGSAGAPLHPVLRRFTRAQLTAVIEAALDELNRRDGDPDLEPDAELSGVNIGGPLLPGLEDDDEPDTAGIMGGTPSAGNPARWRPSRLIQTGRAA